jgi:tRNA(Ile)-lysidine synthase
VLQRVTATVREHAMFDPGDRVLAMVSGGPDSMCLLHSLHMLRRLLRIEIEVFHFDHRLRPESGKDADYVRRAAARLGVPFHLRVAEDEPAKGESVEEWARRARLAAVLDVRTRTGLRRVATGHTLDDQAETLLLAMIHGRGLSGMAGIQPVMADALVRPMLDVRRSEVEAFCRSLGLRPRGDPTNLDPRFLRNAIRLEVMPVLERASGRDVKAAFARTADLLRRELPEATAWDSSEMSDQAAISVAKLREASPPASARLVRDALLALSGARMTRAHIEAVLDLARGRPGRRRNLPGGLLATRDREYVRLSRTSPTSRSSPESQDR